MESQNGQPGDRVEGLVSISEMNEERRDIGLAKRAAHEGWNVPAADRPKIVKRMVDIVARTSVPMATMTGVVEDERVADAHAIQASRVLLDMTNHGQRDRHHDDKLAQDDKHIALGVADLALRCSDADFIALARKHNRTDLLPPDLRAQIG